MSLEASEIITSLSTTLRQHLTDLHNQNINDNQAMISRVEERLVLLQASVAKIEARLTEIEHNQERSA